MTKVGIIEFDKLEIGDSLMIGNTYLREWRCPLSKLTSGHWMFKNCSNLKTFSSDLSSMTDGGNMFEDCSNLTTFNANLHSLTHGINMFTDCISLKTFSSDLSSLMYGSNMFIRTGLVSFTSDLPSLTHGINMFQGCSLDAASVQHIADTINDLKSKNKTGSIYIGHAEDVPSIILYESGEKLTNKGWTVYFNGVKWEGYGLYDVVKRWGYIPDASKWNEEKYIPNNLIITEITAKGDMINNE